MAGRKDSKENVADWFGRVGKKASDAIAKHTPTAVKRGGLGAAVGGALGTIGAGVAVLVQGVALNAIGFTTLGPAAGSYAAGWMSSIAISNGVGVSTGSLYAALQSAAMGGGALVGAPIVIGTCAATGVVFILVKHYTERGGAGDRNSDGDPPAGGDESTNADGDGDTDGDAPAGGDESTNADGDGNTDGDAPAGGDDSTNADEDEEDHVTAEEQP